MKAVLVGADLMYRKDGSLAPIEINTNTGWDDINRVELLEDVFDLTDLVEFVEDYEISKIYLEGMIQRIADPLKEILPEGVEVILVNQVEMENLEDADNILAIRTYYSDEALVDSFCRDKITFLESISDKGIGCEYLLKTGGELEGEITQIETDYPAGVPNFILKYRYPNYDKNNYPKLLRFNSIQDLMDYAEEEMEDDHFLMPFYYNEDKLLYDGTRIPLIRELNIFVAVDGSLESIEVGKYTKVCDHLKLDEVEYEENGELKPEYREMFLSAGWFSLPLTREQALLEEGDLVWMSDGTWKPIEEVEVGDVLKSLEIPAKEGYDTNSHTGDYGIDVEQLEEETNYIDNEVTDLWKVNRIDDVISFNFTDGTSWVDTVKSSYPTVAGEDANVVFKTLDMVQPGESIVLIDIQDTETPKFVIKEVESVEKERKLTEGYGITLDGSHLFISRTQEDEQAYASIEHNYAVVVYQCGSVSAGGTCTAVTSDAQKINNPFQPSGLSTHNINIFYGQNISIAYLYVNGHHFLPDSGTEVETQWGLYSPADVGGLSITMSNVNFTTVCGGVRYNYEYRTPAYFNLSWQGLQRSDSWDNISSIVVTIAKGSCPYASTVSTTVTISNPDTNGNYDLPSGYYIVSIQFNP